MSPDRGDTLGLGNLPPQQQQKNQSDLGVAEILLTDKVSKIITTSSKKEPIITTTAGKQQSILPDKMSNKEQLANKPLNTSNHSTCHKHMPPTTKRSYFFKEMKCFVCLFYFLKKEHLTKVEAIKGIRITHCKYIQEFVVLLQARPPTEQE